jgi:predicted ATPase
MLALLCPELIGRSDELEELRALLSETRRGRGGLALISGEAGVGKSRFVASALQEL